VTAPSLPREKFSDPDRTATGEPRARVPLIGLETLWFNTGTLCNLSCANCYMESTPTNDALIYLSLDTVNRFLDEVESEGLPLREVGFTGGEPFMNPEFTAMLDAALERGHRVLVLTNAMRPMQRRRDDLLALRDRYGERLGLRVSLDHYTGRVHEAERGAGSWTKALDGLRWLSDQGFPVAAAGRTVPGESAAQARAGFSQLFRRMNIAVDAADPASLVLFPEMDVRADVAEVTSACWSKLQKSPADPMCASSRMIVHRKGEAEPRVVACTLIPHDANFDLGGTLREASRPVALNHPHCARFCVLGGAKCSG
jgi:hypothetical protein